MQGLSEVCRFSALVTPCRCARRVAKLGLCYAWQRRPSVLSTLFLPHRFCRACAYAAAIVLLSKSVRGSSENGAMTREHHANAKTRPETAAYFVGAEGFLLIAIAITVRRRRVAPVV